MTFANILSPKEAKIDIFFKLKNNNTLILEKIAKVKIKTVQGKINVLLDAFDRGEFSLDLSIIILNDKS